MFEIRADAAHIRGKMNDHDVLRVNASKRIHIQAFDVIRVNEVVVLDARDKDVRRATLFQFFDDERAEKARSACNDHFFVFPKIFCHGILLEKVNKYTGKQVRDYLFTCIPLLYDELSISVSIICWVFD